MGTRRRREMSLFHRRVTYIVILLAVCLGMVVVWIFYPIVDIEYLAARTGVSRIKEAEILYSFGPPAVGDYELHCFIKHSPKVIDDVLKEKKRFLLSVTIPNSNDIGELKEKLTQLGEPTLLEKQFNLADTHSYLALCSSSVDEGKVVKWIVSPCKQYSFISIYAFH